MLFRMNYTNFTVGEKFRNFMELYNVTELYVFFSERTSYIAVKVHNSITAIVSCSCTLLHLTSGPIVQCTTQSGGPKAMYSIDYAR